MKYRVKHLIEYAALRTVAALVNVLPHRAALSVGWALAALTHFVGRYQVKETRRRIREVLGMAVTERDVSRISWESWRNMFFNVIEDLRFSAAGSPWLDRLCDYDEAQRILSMHVQTGQGAVLALPHMGNWDLAGLKCRLHNLPLFSIAGLQRNPLTNDFINQLRGRSGMSILTRGAGTMREVLRRLKGNEILAILPDVRVRTEGVRVPFLGKEANLGPGMAQFARQTGIPIFPCICARKGWTRHTGKLYDPIFPDPQLGKQEDIRRMTTEVLQIVEHAIREDPGQWFWYNKRWVLEPLENG